ncbi:MAG: hydrogenase maturation protease [Spirochaetes bacterium]|nr:hydrogenase maturation protease [Spirochaetota bacterium]
MPGNIGAVSHINRILVMGIGNLLLGDEGLGVHAIRELQNMKLPDDVELLDAGTAFINALSYIGDVHKLVIIDAIQEGKRPGAVYRIQIKHDSCMNYSTSIHGISIIDMMKIVQGPSPDSVTVFGVEPEYIGWGMELSDTIKGSMPLLIEAVCREITTYSKTSDLNECMMPRVC